MQIDQSCTDSAAAAAFTEKIALYFSLHILPEHDPESIEWWLSLSGGKDSFAMAIAIRDWYNSRGLRFHAHHFTIDQWGGQASQTIARTLSDFGVTVIDARVQTQAHTRYTPGMQAPCRTCADVRRFQTDSLVQSGRTKFGMKQFIARGLHLSDTATSIAWRNARGRDGAAELIRMGKCTPLARLSSDTFLAKPLSYAREYESEQYALALGYRHSCCGCPACKHPSRRDIVEESILLAYPGQYWEFDVPGLHKFLKHWGADEIQQRSCGGIARKHPHLPQDFASFAVDRFRSRARSIPDSIRRQLDQELDLDAIGSQHLLGNNVARGLNRIPMPALLINRELSQLERAMIATLGPFWGAMGLESNLATTAQDMQNYLFDFSPDEHWRQVNDIISIYYRISEQNRFQPIGQRGRIIPISSTA